MIHLDREPRPVGLIRYPNGVTTLSDTLSHYVCARPARCGCPEWALCPPWVLDRVNPLYIPRNHLVEEAPSAATGGDLDPFERLLEAVAAPYDERPGLERYAVAASADFGTYRTFCGT